MAWCFVLRHTVLGLLCLSLSCFILGELRAEEMQQQEPQAVEVSPSKAEQAANPTEPENATASPEAEEQPPEVEEAPPAADTEETKEQQPEVLEPDANGTELLERAQNLFEYGDYPSMSQILEAGLEANKFNEEQLPTVRRLLGIGSFILQDRKKARENFLILLTLNPDEQLDPLYVPPIIIDTFESIRSEHKEMLDAIRAERLKAKEEKPEEERVDVVRKYNPYFVNFIPFGAGQYQNGEAVKGTLFLTGEVVLLGLNVASYFVSDSLKGDDGLYSSDNAKMAREWRIVQYTALGALTVLAVGGIVDAVLNHREYVDVPIETEPLKDESLPQPEGEPIEKEKEEAAQLLF